MWHGSSWYLVVPRGTSRYLLVLSIVLSTTSHMLDRFVRGPEVSAKTTHCARATRKAGTYFYSLCLAVLSTPEPFSL